MRQHILATFFQGDNVGDNHHDKSHDASIGDSRYGPEGIELRTGMCESAKHISHGEQAEGSNEDDLAPKDVGEPAIENLEGRIGYERRGAGPDDGGSTVEIVADGGQSNANRVLVNVGDEHGSREGTKDDDELVAFEQVGLVVDHDLFLDTRDHLGCLGMSHSLSVGEKSIDWAGW